MPTRPPRICPHPGCTTPTKTGLCEGHRVSRQRADQKRRGTASERGYTYQWSKASRVYRMKHPLCARCLSRGVTRVARCVDHIKPWQSGTTEEERRRLFWDEANWQSLCWRCHSQKTYEEDGTFGRAKKTDSVESRTNRANDDIAATEMSQGGGRDGKLPHFPCKPTIHEFICDGGSSKSDVRSQEVTEEGRDGSDEEVTGPRVREL